MEKRFVKNIKKDDLRKRIKLNPIKLNQQIDSKLKSFVMKDIKLGHTTRLLPRQANIIFGKVSMAVSPGYPMLENTTTRFLPRQVSGCVARADDSPDLGSSNSSEDDAELPDPLSCQP